ncbi:hypothetical protein EG830_08255 [bacterium]|nr:hypothetical protein [bacterium]
MKSVDDIIDSHCTKDFIPREVVRQIAYEYGDQFHGIESMGAVKDSKLWAILRNVCDKLSVSVDEVVSDCRDRHLTDARAIYCRRARYEFPSVSWTRIGKIINRDHSSAYAATQRALIIKDIDKKYIECYARKTQINYALMAINGKSTGDIQDNSEREGSILSHSSMEAGKPFVQGEVSSVRRVS